MGKQIILKGNKVVRNDFKNETGYIRFIIAFKNNKTGKKCSFLLNKMEDDHYSVYDNAKGKAWHTFLWSVYSAIKSKGWKYDDVTTQIVEFNDDNYDKVHAWVEGITVEELKERQEQEKFELFI